MQYGKRLTQVFELFSRAKKPPVRWFSLLPQFIEKLDEPFEVAVDKPRQHVYPPEDPAKKQRERQNLEQHAAVTIKTFCKAKHPAETPTQDEVDDPVVANAEVNFFRHYFPSLL